jgi:hypothetical protein
MLKLLASDDSRILKTHLGNKLYDKIIRDATFNTQSVYFEAIDEQLFYEQDNAHFLYVCNVLAHQRVLTYIAIIEVDSMEIVHSVHDTDMNIYDFYNHWLTERVIGKDISGVLDL